MQRTKFHRSSRKKARGSRERGQAAVFLVLALGLFLIGGIGFVVDGANLWFHRQTAQTAADAACTAGAMDMLSVAAGVTPPATNWIPATDDASSFHCNGTTGSTQNSSFPPCSYANLNGYSGTASQDVQVSFPTLTVAADCPTDPPFSATVCAADAVASTPYLQVTITDSVPTTFMRFVGAGPSTAVPARSKCGLSNVLSAVPILALNPNTAGGGAANTLLADDGFNLTVLNGAQKSIQVNSSDPGAVSLSTASIDLSQANAGNGGSFSVASRESQGTAGGTVTGGTWVNAGGVVSDAFAEIAPPQKPGTDCSVPGNCVAYHQPPGTGECPANASCDVYQPGYYPDGITVQAGDSHGASGLAVFEPGIYYLDGDFTAGDSCLRPGDSAQGIGGTLFYFDGNHTLSIGSNSGTLTETRRVGGRLRTVFNCRTTTVSLSGTSCISNLPAAAGDIGGNVLLGPCSGTYGDPTGTGSQRGMLFFQDRDSQVQTAPTWNPSGSFALIGNLYFHQCHLNGSSGSGANCDSTAFSDTLTLGSGGAAYIVGDVVADQLHLSGTSNITVSLNPNPQYYVLKASLLQ